MTTISIGNVVIKGIVEHKGQVQLIAFDRFGDLFEDAANVRLEDMSAVKVLVPKFLWRALVLLAEQLQATTKALEHRLTINWHALDEPHTTLDKICGVLAKADAETRIRVTS